MTKHDTDTLNELIESLLDSIKGYEESAQQAEGLKYKDVFTARAAERRPIVSQFQAEVRRIGGEPTESGTTAGAAHRLFVNLRSMMSSGDEAVLIEVERGEDHLKEKFSAALRDSDLSASVMQMVSAAFGTVRKGHDQAKAMRDQLKAA